MRVTLLITIIVSIVIAVSGCVSYPDNGYYPNGVYVEQNGVDVFYKDGLPVQSSKEK